MKLRRELLLLRDGTAQETEIRTNKIAQLGRALEAVLREGSSAATTAVDRRRWD